MHRENGDQPWASLNNKITECVWTCFFKDNYFLENPQFVQLLELKENEFIAAGIGPYAMKN